MNPKRATAFPSPYLVCISAGAVEGGGHGRGRERVLSSGEGGGRRLNQRRRVTEGTQTPLLGQELLVCYWVDVRGEAERRTEEDGIKQSEGMIISEQITSDCK